ncbi:MAG: FAD-dependent oxidoreductase [Deltaproteobacteria bacterium]
MSEASEFPSSIAIIGGATAGAEAAERLRAAGALCVVFEQNDRPYGKVEDGLPMWHEALRNKEYATIDKKLDQPGVEFVPATGIGRDITFNELLEDWGFDLILLANGAWRDRPLPVTGADAYINRGLVYQNPFIYWFNHYREPGYHGPTYQVQDGAIVVGGGLASIDVAKLIQLELTLAALAKRGIHENLIEMETSGIPAVLESHNLKWEDLELKGCTIYYRRRIEDMPLAEAPPNATPEKIQKVEAIRCRILEKARKKLLFNVEPLWSPIGLLTEGDQLGGLRFARTRIDEKGKAAIVPGEIRNVEAQLVISSIGSIPEPIEGLPMDGELLRLEDKERGKVVSFENVFGCGNVVTGKGNLVASRKHSASVAGFLQEQIPQSANGDPTRASQILQRTAERHKAIGYTDYRLWIDAHAD